MTPDDNKKEMFDRDENPSVDSQRKESISVEQKMATEDENPTGSKSTNPVEAVSTSETKPLSRKERREAKYMDLAAQEAKSKGVDFNYKEGIPLLDQDKKEMIERFKPVADQNSLGDFLTNRVNSYTSPELKDVKTPDQKVIAESIKRQKRARFADALYAFGEGLQGKTANREAMATTRLQRKRDEEFQNFKEATEYNRQARNLWNKQVSDETLKWLDEQAGNQRLDQLTREKMQAAADQYRQNMAFKENQLKQAKQIADDRNAASIKAAAIRASNKKDDDKIEVQTSKQLHKLTPAEYAKIKRDVLSNIDKYKDRYKDWFIEKPEMTKDKYGLDVPTGKTTIELRPQIKDDELVGAYLEEQDNPLLPEPGSAAYFDRYRKEKGLPTSDQPLLQPKQSQTKQSTTQVQAKKPSLFQ